MFREKEKLNSYYVNTRLYLSESLVCDGVGVFASDNINKYQILEVAPVVIFSETTAVNFQRFYNDSSLMTTISHHHIILDYPFWWPNSNIAFGLGWAGIYNHHPKDPNAFWVPQHDGPIDALVFRAKRDISCGEEVCTKYSYDARKTRFAPSNDDVHIEHPSAWRYSDTVSDLSRDMSKWSVFKDMDD